MNFRQMKIRCPGAVFITKARLDGWSYFINENGYAGIEKIVKTFTLGGVWELSEKHINSLDVYEAVSEGYYERTKIKVSFDPGGDERETIVYLSNSRKYGKPGLAYQRSVIEGAREIGLPQEYIDALSSWS